MAWIPVTITAGGKTYATKLSDDAYVIDGDKFLAFAILRIDGTVSHYVWNPKRQAVSSLRKAFGEVVGHIPHLLRSGMETVALSTVGGQLAGPRGRIIGVIASKVVPFDKLWQALSVHEDKEIGYYEAESGQLSEIFPDIVRIRDVQLVKRGD